jgi:hypothetical protein
MSDDPGPQRRTEGRSVRAPSGSNSGGMLDATVVGHQAQARSRVPLSFHSERSRTVSRRLVGSLGRPQTPQVGDVRAPEETA